MVFRRQHLLILGTEVLGEAHKAEIQAVGHRGSWEAERIMGGTGGLGEAQKAEIKAAGTGHCGRLGGSWEAQRIVGGTGGLGEAQKAESQAVGHRGLWGAPRIMGGSHS